VAQRSEGFLREGSETNMAEMYLFRKPSAARDLHHNHEPKTNQRC
jgi:hypothetical protein